MGAIAQLVHELIQVDQPWALANLSCSNFWSTSKGRGMAFCQQSGRLRYLLPRRQRSTGTRFAFGQVLKTICSKQWQGSSLGSTSGVPSPPRTTYGKSFRTACPKPSGYCLSRERSHVDKVVYMQLWLELFDIYKKCMFGHKWGQDWDVLSSAVPF